MLLNTSNEFFQRGLTLFQPIGNKNITIISWKIRIILRRKNNIMRVVSRIITIISEKCKTSILREKWDYMLTIQGFLSVKVCGWRCRGTRDFWITKNNGWVEQNLTSKLTHMCDHRENLQLSCVCESPWLRETKIVKHSKYSILEKDYIRERCDHQLCW